MKRLANITITLTTLVLLTFGAGGVSMMKCACSGKTTLLTLSYGNCCPTESNCMTVTTAQLSESILPDHVNLPQLPPVALQASLWIPIDVATTFSHTIGFVSTGYPPPRLPLTTVLRV